MAGSTGEAAALDEREYSTLLEYAVARVRKRIPLLAGTGLSATPRRLADPVGSTESVNCPRGH